MDNFLFVLVFEMRAVVCTNAHHMVSHSPLRPCTRREVLEHTMPSRAPCARYTVGRVVVRDS